METCAVRSILCFLSLSLSLSCLVPVCQGAGQTEYYNLVNHLFQNYKKEVRPTTQGEHTSVYLNMFLKSIVDLDEKEQVLKAYVTLQLQWVDDYLTWTPSSYGNITRILYPQKQLWIPDIINENSVESQTQLGYDQLVCAIDNTGVVAWHPSEVLQTSCDLDVTYYPFDAQVCELVFSTVLSTKVEVDIDAFDNGRNLDLSHYSKSGTWDLVDAFVTEPSETDTSRIVFKVVLKRLRQYYVMNIILPLLLLSSTASFVFLLPADAGEKIGMGITVLLAFAVYLTIISEETPKTSKQTSILSVYLIGLLALTTFAVILSVVVLNYHFKADEIPISPGVIRWTRKLRRILRLVPAKPKARGNKVEPSEDNLSLDDLTVRSNNDNVSEDRREIVRNRFMTKHFKASPDDGSAMDDGQEEEDITWPKVAETMDRFFFFLFTFIITGLTAVILPLIIVLADSQAPKQ